MGVELDFVSVSFSYDAAPPDIDVEYSSMPLELHPRMNQVRFDLFFLVCYDLGSSPGWCSLFNLENLKFYGVTVAARAERSQRLCGDDKHRMNSC
jgi:hypothetical protein